MSEIVAFNQAKADIALLKAENTKLVFDYEDPKDNKEARSQVYKLRKARTSFDKLRKETKADALQACQNIDAAAKVYIKEFDEMIDVHGKPLKLIEDREEAEKQAALDKIKADREAEEAARLLELEAKEKELEELKTKAKAEEDRIAQEKREKQIAEDAAAEAKADAAAEAKRIEDARIAAELAEKAEKERAAEEQRKIVENKTHRREVEDNATTAIVKVLGSEELAAKMLVAIKENKITHVTINYYGGL